MEPMDMKAMALNAVAMMTIPHDLAEEKYGIVWSPEGQEIYGGLRMFRHAGAINTYPSHDMAHALVAASGRLPWVPSNLNDETRVAEYNAVFLENLLDKTLHYVTHDHPHPDSILRKSLKYLRWFVYEHFAPFPMPAEEAYRRFCLGIDPERVVRLSPLFFELRRAQHETPDYMQRTWNITFDPCDTPPGSATSDRCQRVFADVIAMITCVP